MSGWLLSAHQDGSRGPTLIEETGILVLPRVDESLETEHLRESEQWMTIAYVDACLFENVLLGFIALKEKWDSILTVGSTTMLPK